MKKIIVIISLVLFSSVLFAQEIMMNETPDSLYKISKWGQNRKHYLNFYLDYGMAVGKAEGSIFDIKYGLSREWKFGLRYKRRLCEHYAMGLDLSISEYRYYIAQFGTNVFPDIQMHEKEYLGLPMVGLEYYNRINFGRRGDKIGNYLDLGVYGTYTYSAYQKFWDKFPTPINGATKAKITLSDLNYLTDLQWGFKARIGFNQFAIWASYRMSDWFNSKVHNSLLSGEFPRTTIGIEIGFF